MARKKIKLKEEAISEILVADTNLESKHVFQLKSRHNKLASKINHPTALSSVFFLQPEKGHSV